jgi:hypothetical protein
MYNYPMKNMFWMSTCVAFILEFPLIGPVKLMNYAHREFTNASPRKQGVFTDQEHYIAMMMFSIFLYITFYILPYICLLYYCYIRIYSLCVRQMDWPFPVYSNVVKFSLVISVIYAFISYICMFVDFFDGPLWHLCYFLILFILHATLAVCIIMDFGFQRDDIPLTVIESIPLAPDNPPDYDTLSIRIIN